MSRRRRDRARPPDDEASWLRDEAQRDPTERISSDLTVGELVEFHRRPPTPEGWLFEPSVPYDGGRGRPLVAHVYRPRDVVPPRPAVIFVHGGGWTDGHPFSNVRRAASCAAHGWFSAAITYRRAQEAPWPAQLDDVRTAVRWVRDRAQVLGVDPERIAIAGESAGGQLAALAALDEDLAVSAAVLWYPVVDLLAAPRLGPAIALLTGGDRDIARHASPLHRVHGRCPPVLTFAGSEDDTAPISSVRAFHAALDGAAVPNRLVEVPAAGHAFDFAPEAWRDTMRASLEFLDPHLAR